MGKFLVIYFDDILVFSKDKESHGEHLRLVCSILLKEQLYANPKKCTFFTESITFLGFIVSSQGVYTNLDKIKAILE